MARGGGRLEGTFGAAGPRTPEATSAAKVCGSSGAENTLLHSAGGRGLWELCWCASSEGGIGGVWKGMDWDWPALLRAICWSHGEEWEELATEEGWGLRSAGVEADDLRARAFVFTVGRLGGDHARESGSVKPRAETTEGSMRGTGTRGGDVSGWEGKRCARATYGSADGCSECTRVLGVRGSLGACGACAA